MHFKSIDEVGNWTQDARPETLDGALAYIDVLKSRLDERHVPEDAIFVTHAGLHFLRDWVGDAIFFIDAKNGRIRDVSQAACSLMGLSRENLAGRCQTELHPIEDREFCATQFRECVRLAGEGRACRSLPVTLARADGSRITGQMAVMMLSCNGERLACCVFNSPAIHGLMGSGLQESEAYYAQSLPRTGDGAWSWNPGTGEVYLSWQWKALLGYGEAFKATAESCNALLHPDEREAVLGVMNACARGATPSFSLEYRLLGQDGRYRWVHGRGASVRNPAGRVTLLAGVTTDITERKEAELALAEARDAAIAANRAKTEFLASMSHEIRTPMNIILGMAELLGEQAATPAQKQFVEAIENSGQMLLRLLNDILDLSRIEADRVELRREPFSPADLVGDVCQTMQVAAAQKHLDFSTACAPDLPATVVNDADRVRQVLVNLIWNAVKFTDVGGIEVRLSRCAGTDGRPWLHFAVSDTGPGVAPELLTRIFDPFTRAETACGQRHCGVGLGLAISKRLVELMGGGIAIDSIPGRGATFSFTLPMGTAAATTAWASVSDSRASYGQAARSSGAAGGRRWRLLAAEDSEANQELLRLFLEDEPYDITMTATGQEAVAAFGRERFDAVLMDVEMPGMSGLEASAAIRRLEAASGAPPTPLVLLTAHAFSEYEARGRAAGCDGFLTKPIRKARLLDALARLVSGGRLD